MEIGEYCRTEEGIIGKLERIINETDFEGKSHLTVYKLHIEKNEYHIALLEEIVKHSKNIIDLIEEGDIIEHKIGEYIFKDEVWKIKNGKIICTDGYVNAVRREDIKSIVTKEQFNSIKYEVE